MIILMRTCYFFCNIYKYNIKAGVDEFVRILGEYGIPATPRTRRGIDIDAGCGQLKADLLKRRKSTSSSSSSLVEDLAVTCNPSVNKIDDGGDLLNLIGSQYKADDQP